MNAPHEEAVEFAKVSKRENRVYVGNLSYDVKYRDLMEFMRGGGLGDPRASASFRFVRGGLGLAAGTVMAPDMGDRGDVIADVAADAGQVKVEVEDADEAKVLGHARLDRHRSHAARSAPETASDGSWSRSWSWRRGGRCGCGGSHWSERGPQSRIAAQSPWQHPSPTYPAEFGVGVLVG